MDIITHCFLIKIFTLSTQSVSFCSNAPASPVRKKKVIHARTNAYIRFLRRQQKHLG